MGALPKRSQEDPPGPLLLRQSLSATEMTFLDQDWTEEQAQGVLDGLKLEGGTPKWKLEHLRRLHDWCSANDKDPATVDGQLDFIAFELCSGFQGVGRALKQAKTADEARQVVEPYARRLRVPEMQSEQDRVLSSPTISGVG
jgi:hypothetical protein